MTWLLTRVIISSTVCPEGARAAAAGADAGAAAGFVVFGVDGKGASACPIAREGRDIKATRTREYFFMDVLAATLAGLRAKGGLGPKGDFTPSEGTQGLQPISLTPGRARKLATAGRVLRTGGRASRCESGPERCDRRTWADRRRRLLQRSEPRCREPWHRWPQRSGEGIL